MRWHIGGQGWPIAGGARLIPAATLIGDGGIPLSELPTPLPIDSISLDDAALAQMRAWYPLDQHRLVFGPDVGKAPAQTTSAPKKSAKG
jgi:hypothetical protein